MKIIILLVCCFFSFQYVIAQSADVKIKTQGVILEINKKHSRKYVKEIATVSYTTNDGLELESYLELVRLPILGSFKSVGDEIEIYYTEDNPAFIETKSSSFIRQYGMYFLIALGVVFSFRTLKNVYAQQQ